VDFKLVSNFKPSGDQPQAIDKLINGLNRNFRCQTLLGVTGSGKTFTMAGVIARLNRPTLVIAHNKTLAAQLTQEFREFFPHNAVEYFVSYYDYYQPEAYLPSSDTYIEKEAQINDEIDRLRHSATQSLLTRRDVIVVASVSCIYGLGSPETYKSESLLLKAGAKFDRAKLMRDLINLHFVRSTGTLKRGEFRVRGATFDIFPINQEYIFRLNVIGDVLSSIIILNPLTSKPIEEVKETYIFPAKHFVTPEALKKEALRNIRLELAERLEYFRKRGLLLETERLERRTRYDLELISEIGYCNGIENYSRHLSGRAEGSPPDTLLSYFPKDFLLFIDESHATVPQLNGMYNGDHARKLSLIDNGFRLPSAYDNRPLTFKEFGERVNQTIFVSATPAAYEREKSQQIVEQIIRPTGLVDPEVIIRPIVETKTSPSQVDDLIHEVKIRAGKNERVLVTTLTKKMAEDLSDYLSEAKVKTKYLHSDVKTIDRIRILTDFRAGKFDCLVGVNLLREGLDLPEVTLVAILDADKEGFLRSETSLIQTIGRAARNVAGQVILYADNITGSIKRAVDITNCRRSLQLAYNKKHGITPQTIRKEVKDITALWGLGGGEAEAKSILELETRVIPKAKIGELIMTKEKEMKEAAHDLEFELAAILRDELTILKKRFKSKTKTTP